MGCNSYHNNNILYYTQVGIWNLVEHIYDLSFKISTNQDYSSLSSVLKLRERDLRFHLSNVLSCP
jgi:hypothetical protein